MPVKATLTPVKTTLTLELEGDPLEVNRLITRILEIANERPSQEKSPVVEATRVEAAQNELLMKQLWECEFSFRTRKIFIRLGLNTLGDLVKKTPDELLSLRNFGPTSLTEVRSKLEALGLSLAGDA